MVGKNGKLNETIEVSALWSIKLLSLKGLLPKLKAMQLKYFHVSRSYPFGREAMFNLPDRQCLQYEPRNITGRPGVSIR